MKMICILLMLASAPGGDFEGAVLRITGADCLEELPQDELERFHSLAENPVHINTAGRARLLASGLFSVYQAASLLERRASAGDILSVTELGLVDGFSPQLARDLAHFVSLSPSSARGASDAKTKGDKLRQTLVLRGSGRAAGTLSAAWRTRYAAEAGSKASLRLTLGNTLSDPQTHLPPTVSIAVYGRGKLSQMVFGDFSARFGQGLVAWSGFRMSGYGTADSFLLKPSGIGITGSASSEMKGIAATWDIGRWSASAAYSFSGSQPVANLTGHFRSASIGLNATSRAVSVDWHAAGRGASFFGEAAAAYDGEVSALSGLLWIPRYGTKAALLGRWLGTSGRQYSGAALAFENRWTAASLDLGYRADKALMQHKASVQLRRNFRLGRADVGPALKMSARLRPSDAARWRTALRADCAAISGPFRTALRYEFCHCRSTAHLCYIESGYSRETAGIFVRASVFRIDDWEDRIYVYERDAPGTFNVPAYYGRGFSASVFARLRFRRRHSLWLRIAALQYPWQATARPGRLDASLQYRLQL